MWKQVSLLQVLSAQRQGMHGTNMNVCSTSILLRPYKEPGTRLLTPLSTVGHHHRLNLASFLYQMVRNLAFIILFFVSAEDQTWGLCMLGDPS